jgi:hypothetical protein
MAPTNQARPSYLRELFLNSRQAMNTEAEDPSSIMKPNGLSDGNRGRAMSSREFSTKKTPTAAYTQALLAERGTASVTVEVFTSATVIRRKKISIPLIKTSVVATERRIRFHGVPEAYMRNIASATEQLTTTNKKTGFFAIRLLDEGRIIARTRLIGQFTLHLCPRVPSPSRPMRSVASLRSTPKHVASRKKGGMRSQAICLKRLRQHGSLARPYDPAALT